jgi:hypothetical protein
MIGYQQERSEAEKAMPDYMLPIFDAARSGYDYVTHRPMTREEVETLFSAWRLPSPYAQKPLAK